MKQTLLLFLCLSVIPLKSQEAPTALELKKGDHISIIGNTLAERMQHHGWLETLLHAHYPRHELRLRNLAVSGDELTTRLRSEGFGSPDEWLTKEKTDVLFAFFGFNESFAGPDGLKQFETDLRSFIKDTREKQYNGEAPPRLVLFSPIACEDHPDPNVMVPEENNENIARYTQAMERVAGEEGVQFVDLFEVSRRLYRDAKSPLTFNGIHLTSEGNKALAPEIFRDLVGFTAPSFESQEVLRQAVLDKNESWFGRYRTVDGYNVYGGRSHQAYESPKGGPRVSNRVVMQREMEIRDAMTANHDKRVWAAALRKDVPVSLEGVPEPIRVQSNKPGPNPDKTHKFLSGEEAMANMKLAKGCVVNLFADEEQFPDLINPVQIAWDTQHRLWVAAWRTYPEREPNSPVGDKLLVLEDLDQDGKADKVTTFADDLNSPTGFQFYQDGVLVVQAPDLWFMRDTDNDGKADWKERVISGIDSADTHHTSNAVKYDPGGAIYLSDGVFHRTQVETARGPVRNIDGAIFRYEPRTYRFERYIPYGFANPHGKVFDHWGNDLITDATGNRTYFGPAFSGYISYPRKHAGLKEFWKRPSRPCPATGLLSSRHFPEEFRDNFLNLNVIGFQGIFRVKVSEDGAGLKGETLEHLVESSDPNFRPIDICMGPEGAIYFSDWHNPIIGHLQHHIRDPNRDHKHGRIYRITYEGRELLPRVPIHGQPINELVELLSSPEYRTRELAKIELAKHDSNKVIPVLARWVKQVYREDPHFEHHWMEALWVLQWLNVVDDVLLKRLMRSPEPRARAAAVRVLGYWRDRVKEPLRLMQVLAKDKHPRVRLEVVRVASFFEGPQAVKVALMTRSEPGDYYLDYTLGETMKQLDPWWRDAIFEDKAFARDNPGAVEYLLNRVDEDELAKLPRIPAVLRVIMQRPGMGEQQRLAALAEVAEAEKKSSAEVLVDMLSRGTDDAKVAIGDLARLLKYQPPADLKPLRERIDRLHIDSPHPAIRQYAAAALMVADNSIETVWNQTVTEAPLLANTLRAIPTLLDADLRATAQARVKPLLTALPKPIADKVKQQEAALGRFVRISLPRNGTLTLAEVEVISDGRNVAPRGKASQSSVGFGGVPERAIDGNKNPEYNAGGQTHTEENKPNPWWELDLQREMSIESIEIWNRAGFVQRLEGFDLQVLDGSRGVVFETKANPAPDLSAAFNIADDTPGVITRAAINALVSTGEDQAGTFNQLAGMVVAGEYRTTAASAILQLPRDAWQKETSARTAQAVLDWAKTVPAAERTSQDYLEVVNTGNQLTARMPLEEGARIRKGLRDLGVSVFLVKTVREQMRYDVTRLVVEAGKPFEVLFENNDFMPHNLVVVTPGSREAIGKKAEAMPFAPGNKATAFIPKDDRILAHTPLVESGESATLKMTAPATPGEYIFVCTYPGHWMVMWGTLVVTKDVDAELAKAIPDPPAAEHHHEE